MNRKESAYSIGVLRLIDPLYIVASQLKTLIAEGIDTLKVIAENMMFIRGDWPEVNMWWPQTMKPKMVIATELKAMKRYPKICLWLWTEINSLMTHLDCDRDHQRSGGVVDVREVIGDHEDYNGNEFEELLHTPLISGLVSRKGLSNDAVPMNWLSGNTNDTRMIRDSSPSPDR